MKPKNCILQREVGPAYGATRHACRPSECPHCGWDKDEAARRQRLMAKRGLTTLRNGLRGLDLTDNGRRY